MGGYCASEEIEQQILLVRISVRKPRETTGDNGSGGYGGYCVSEILCHDYQFYAPGEDPLQLKLIGE